MTEQPPRIRRGFLFATLGFAVLVLVVGFAIPAPGGGAPTVTWMFGAERRTVQPFDRVTAWEPMEAEVYLPFDGYVYVVTFDHVRGTVTYFPTEYLGTDHGATPVAMCRMKAGRHRLPGTWEDKPQAWYVPSLEESVSLCVVVSREPMADLDQILPSTRQVGNKAFRDRSFGEYMPRAGRDKLIGARKLPHAALLAARDHSGLDASMIPWPERPGVFIGGFNVLPGKPPAGATHPGNPFARQLHDAVDKRRTASGQDGPIRIDIQPDKPGEKGK